MQRRARQARVAAGRGYPSEAESVAFLTSLAMCCACQLCPRHACQPEGLLCWSMFLSHVMSLYAAWPHLTTGCDVKDGQNAALFDNDCFSLLKASSVTEEYDSVSHSSSRLASCQRVCICSCHQNHISTDTCALHACTQHLPQTLAMVLTLGHRRARSPKAECASS